MKSPYKTENRSQLYHNKYKYRIKFPMVGAGRTYWSTDIVEFEIRAKEMRFGRQEPYDRDTIDKFLQFKCRHLSTTPGGSYRLHKYRDMIITVTHDNVTVFSNSDAVAKELETTFEHVVVTEALVTIPRGIKYFAKEPERKRRVYMRSKKVDKEFKDTLGDFLANNPDIHPSNGLKRWLNGDLRSSLWYREFLNDSHYMEFDDDGFHTLLVLFLGSKYLGKYYELHKRPA